MFDLRNVIGYIATAILGAIIAAVVAALAPAGSLATHTASLTIAMMVMLGGGAWAVKFPGEITRMLLSSLMLGAWLVMIFASTYIRQNYPAVTSLSPYQMHAALWTVSVGLTLFGILLASLLRQHHNAKESAARMRRELANL